MVVEVDAPDFTDSVYWMNLSLMERLWYLEVNLSVKQITFYLSVLIVSLCGTSVARIIPKWRCDITLACCGERELMKDCVVGEEGQRDPGIYGRSFMYTRYRTEDRAEV